MRSSCAGPRARTATAFAHETTSRHAGWYVRTGPRGPWPFDVAVRCMKKNLGGVFCYISHQILAEHSWCPSLP